MLAAALNKNDIMGRPKSSPYPTHMTVDGDRGGFVVRNPLTRKKQRFAAHEEQAAREAALLLGELVDSERRMRALDAGRPTVSNLVDAWIRDRLQFMPWDKRTRQEHVWKMKRIQRELGDRTVARTDRLFLEDWLAAFCKTADQFNKWRYVLTLLWRYAVSRKLARECEPEKIEPRSQSKKLEMNRKVRKQLDVAGFKAIHAAAPGFLQIAMEQSLVTLQAREEICSMQHPHYRDGYLFVIRDKVSGDSDMAFIKIALTDQLLEIQARSRKLVDTPKRSKRPATLSASPFLVHRQPERRTRRAMAKTPHWTAVAPAYLSKAFAAARDSLPQFLAMPAAERPTFHEIRGLGSRLLRARGVSEVAIQALMTHSNKRTTQIYLDRGADALTDDDYHAVTAPLKLAEVLK
jgi:integrase